MSRVSGVCPECGKPPPRGAALCPEHRLYAVDPNTLALRDDAQLLGHVLDDRYALVGWIGGGGMGAVYLGRDLRLEREVAVKLLQLALTGARKARSRFEREARAVSRLRSDHTVTVFDYGLLRDGALTGMAYIVMERLVGESLAARLRRGPLPPAEAAEVLEHVSRSLGESHDHGIIHRDVKPDNVVVTRAPDGRLLAKLIDFGIARTDDGTRTQPGVVMGTPHYMSPEQCSGAPEIDRRADVYAAGAMLYEMLSGLPPFTGATPMSIIIQHLNDEPLPLDVPDLDDAACSIVRRALEKSPEERFATMEAFSSAFSEAVGGAAQTVLPAPHESAEPAGAPTAADLSTMVDPPAPDAEFEPLTLSEGSGEVSVTEPDPPHPSRTPARIALLLLLTVLLAAGVVELFGAGLEASPAPESPANAAAPEDFAPDLANATPQLDARAVGAVDAAPQSTTVDAAPESATARPDAKPLEQTPPSTRPKRRPKKRRSASRRSKGSRNDGKLRAAQTQLEAALHNCLCDEAKKRRARLANLRGGKALARRFDPRMEACLEPDVTQRCVGGRLRPR